MQRVEKGRGVGGRFPLPAVQDHANELGKGRGVGGTAGHYRGARHATSGGTVVVLEINLRRSGAAQRVEKVVALEEESNLVAAHFRGHATSEKKIVVLEELVWKNALELRRATSGEKVVVLEDRSVGDVMQRVEKGRGVGGLHSGIVVPDERQATSGERSWCWRMPS
jgi:hypothetical protein